MAAFRRRGAAENRKDRSDVYIDVDVRRAVERIEHNGVFAAFRFPVERDGLLVLFRDKDRDAIAQAEAMHERLVRIDIQLLLRFALDIHAAGLAQRIHEPGPANTRFGHFGRQCDAGKQPGKGSTGAADALLFSKNVVLNGGDHFRPAETISSDTEYMPARTSIA